MTYLVRRPADLWRDFDRSLESFFTGPDLMSRMPDVDIMEKKDRYVIEAELPGLSEKDIAVKVENRNLFISTVKEEEKEEKKDEKNEQYLIKERRSFSFSRNFSLPEDADIDSIEAAFKNGVLTVTITKKPEKKPKSIKIKAA